jgi:hypothetical protein
MLIGPIFYLLLNNVDLILNGLNGWNLYFGGHSTILLNGTSGIYFECRKGVRQGDLLSPYLFLLVVEDLNKLLIKDIELGHFKGLGLPILNNQKVLNL